MAEPPQADTSRPGLSPAQELVERARGLAGVLEIRTDTFAARERAAYHIMSHLLAMPTVREFSKRHDYGNEVLRNTGILFPPEDGRNTGFISAVGGQVIQMQEFPFWFSHLTMSNEKLADDYHMVTAIIEGMSWIGWGPLAPGGAGARSALAAGQKALDSGARAVATQAVRGFASGATKAVTGGFSGPVAIAWVIGEFALTAMKERQILLKRELDRRFSEGTLSVETYRKALGDSATLPYVYFARVR